MEDQPQVEIEYLAPALERKQNGAKASASDKCYLKLLEKTLLLDDEDEKLYAQLHDAVFDDVKPQSFLEKIAAKDLVDKIFGELRSRAAIIGLIGGAWHACKYSDDDEREFRAIERYMPNLQKLQRMMDNSEAGPRRSIMKEFRRKAENSTKRKKPN
jgi:hypothetical protein